MVVLVIFVKHHKQVFCREKFPISRTISFLISFFLRWILCLGFDEVSYEQFSNFVWIFVENYIDSMLV